MLIEQIIKVEWREPGPPGRTCISITAYFHDKRKSSSGLLFTAKILQEECALFPPTWGKSQNLAPKC